MFKEADSHSNPPRPPLLGRAPSTTPFADEICALGENGSISTAVAAGKPATLGSKLKPGELVATESAVRQFVVETVASAVETAAEEAAAERGRDSYKLLAPPVQSLPSLLLLPQPYIGAPLERDW